MASSRVIGLDIGSSAVRAVELDFRSGARSGKSAPGLVRFSEAPLPAGAVRDGEVVQPEIVSHTIRKLWSKARFEVKDVVLGVGNQRVLVRELDLPWLPASQIRGSLPFQIGEMLPMSADEALLDFYPSAEIDGPQGRMLRGMLVAAQRDTVTANVLAVESAGLRPVMVDLNGFALLRALSRGEFARATAAFVDIGAAITTVAIASGGQPRLVRSLPSGGQHVTNAVASALNVSLPDAEAIKREIGVGFAVPADRQAAAEAIGSVVRPLVEGIRNTFVYFQSNTPGASIDIIVLTGGGAHLPGLGQYLSSAARLPATLGNPVATLRRGKAVRDLPVGQESLLALSVGLAYGVAA